MPSLITYFIVLLPEMMKWFLGGLTLFILFPLASMALPERHAKRIMNFYHDVLMALINRAILLQRSNGGLRLKKSTFDPTAGKAGAERIRISGEERFFFDPQDLMSTFRDHSFGLAHEDRAVVLDARTAYFGRRFAQLKRAGQWVVEGHRKAFFAIKPDMQTLVRIEDAKAIIQNPATPGVTDRIDNYAEKGQAGFNTGTTAQYMKLLMAAGAGFGMMFIASYLVSSIGAGGGSGSTVIPLVILP